MASTHSSTSPIGEAGRAGEMQVPEIMQAGVRRSYLFRSITLQRSAADCFACMHMLQAIMRHRTAGKFVLTTKKLVQMATIGGAQDLGLDKITGSLDARQARRHHFRPHRRAPYASAGDRYDALVQLAHPSDVDMTMVDGRVLFHNGDFAALRLSTNLKPTPCSRSPRSPPRRSGVNQLHARGSIDRIRGRRNAS